MDSLVPLPRTFYQRSTTTVARSLLGCRLVHRVAGVPLAGKIVEVEAYLGPEDLAAHASKGLTARTEVLFGPPGHAYVYFVYGMHWCFNVVTGVAGQGCAVLLRALEPVFNIEGRTQGPALLCRALQIDGRYNGYDLVGGELFVAGPAANEEPGEVVARPRIGVAYAGAWAAVPLRFFLKGNPFVSKP